MTITVTEKEYNAIYEVLNQVGTDYEAASDKKYLESMSETIGLVNNVLDKYKKARFKAAEFKQVRAYVAERNRNRLRPRDIDKVARQLLKKIKEGENGEA